MTGASTASRVSTELGALKQFAAMFAALVSLVIVALLSAYFVFLPAFALQWSVDRAGGGTALTLAASTLLLPLSFCASLPVVRFLTRWWPLLADGRRRAGCIGVLCFVVLSPLSVLVVAASKPQRPGDPSLGWHDAILLAAVAAPVAFGLSLLIWRYYAGSGTSSGPRLVFLRRFSTFSDGAVLGSVLSALPRGHGLAYLVPRKSEARAFEPLTNAFAGLRFWRPLQAIPVPLVAADETWESSLRLVLARARGVVVDLSTPSGSLGREALLVRAVLGRRVLWLLEAERPDLVAAWGLRGIDVRNLPGERILFTRRWPHALPRILTLLAFMAFVLVVMGVQWSSEFGSASWYVPLAAIVFFTFARVVVHPVLPRGTRNEIRAALRRMNDDAAVDEEPPELVRWFDRTVETSAQPRGLLFSLGRGDAWRRKLEAALVRRGLQVVCVGALARGREEPDAALRSMRAADVVVLDISAGGADELYLAGLCRSLGPKALLVSSSRPVLPTYVTPEDVIVLGDEEGWKRFDDTLATTLRAADEAGWSVLSASVLGAPPLRRRWLAFGLDLALSSLLGGCVLQYARPEWRSGDAGDPGQLLATAACSAYLVLVWVALKGFGCTPGLRAAGLELVDLRGNAATAERGLGRACAFLVPGFFGLGSLALFQGPLHLTVHDFVSGSRLRLRRVDRATRSRLGS